VLTSVVSAVIPASEEVDAEAVAGTEATSALLVGVDDVEGASLAVVDAAGDAALESAVSRLAGIDLDGGNSSWETAIAISDKNRARKKRLSIQGTGS
jgi:hypothetical protein